MEATKKRQISNGEKYAAFFPAASGIVSTIKTNASVGDTITFIKKIVPQTLDQTKKLAAALKGRSTHESCKNIWHFVYQHIRYKKDADGYEQVRSPARAWKDRFSGVDCDCYTTFISSILTNLGIAHTLRITKYQKDYFQHIYPIVPTGKGYITLDCVTDYFNYEVPFSEKKDFAMDLQYLNGFGASPYSSAEDYILSGDDEMGELGLFGRRKKKKREAAEQEAASDPSKWNNDQVPGSGVKKKKGIKKLLNIANKVNPATLLLRNGVLASMKLNIGKVASRLRWSYVTPNQARAKGMDIGRYQQLVKVRQKLENIFYGAGGNPDNMKKAILKGKGNKDKAVNGLLGLGYLDGDDGVNSMNIFTPLPQLLGTDIFFAESTIPAQELIGLSGFGELGEPVTLAAVAAAAAVIAGIAGSLKKIGDLFKGKKTAGSEDFSDEAEAAADKDVQAISKNAPAGAAAAVVSADDSGSNLPATNARSNTPTAYAASASAGSSDSAASADSDGAGSDEMPAGRSARKIGGGGADSSATGDGFWAKNKKWLLPVVIGVGGITVIGIGMKMMKPAPAAPSRSGLRGLNGHPKRRRRKTKPRTRKSHRHHHKRTIGLL